MEVRELLKKKGERLLTAQPDDLVSSAVDTLAKNRIGALPVCSGGKLVGILSERDLIRGVAESGGSVLSRAVRELMSADVHVCKPSDSIRDAMRMMSQHHIRHLPVVEGGALLGILSQRDVMQIQLDMAQLEVNVLRDYAKART
jgi:CBS domain-containing protein